MKFKFPPTDKFPENVEVAVVEVATKADAVEVAAEVMEPELLIPFAKRAFKPETVKAVVDPVRKLKLPDGVRRNRLTPEVGLS